ncbi:MAG TPA: cytidine deaminase [Paludibacter sp.]|nr:cytidine deaminase [Paludibacter sp.]
MQERTVKAKITVLSPEELNGQQQYLIGKAKEQVPKAYAPYSGFHVGAAVELENGEIFAGSNQENSAYPSGLCAERVAMFYANAQYPDVAPTTLAIAAFTGGNFLEIPISPCGSCRQVLLESETRFGKDITVLLYGTKEIYLLENVRQLLPLCFDKNSLQG